MEVEEVEFMERELERISEAVRARQAENSNSDEYRQLYAIQRRG